MTRLANNGCGKDLPIPYIPIVYAIVKRSFRRSTHNVTGKMAPFKMASVSNLEELLQSKNGLLRKTNGTFGILYIFTKQLCQKKIYVYLYIFAIREYLRHPSPSLLVLGLSRSL